LSLHDQWYKQLVEELAVAVHIAYCEEYKKQTKRNYWTKGNYALLPEKVKDIDRKTIDVVIKTLRKKGLVQYV